jgi:hypothetical protein
MSHDESFKSLLRALETENKTLNPNKGKGGVNMKVSEKGALSLYGLGRFPVTLYKSQWEKLLNHVEEIRAFLEEHDGELASKD